MRWVWLQLAIKALLIVAVLPILIGYYVELGKRLTGNRFFRWTIKNWAFWVLSVLLIPTIFFEIKFSESREIAEEKPLAFFELSTYQSELDQYIPPQPSPNWTTEKQQLVRIFEHAQYAWKSADYNEATDSLLALETGQDKIGSLQKVASFVISNDLGCVYFKQQRNKEFKAFIYFQTAKDRVGSKEPYKGLIEKNMRALDEMVNKID